MQTTRGGTIPLSRRARALAARTLRSGRRSAHRALAQRRGGYDEAIWLLGDGRSGTTWVASLINGSGRCRELFEPVHPILVDRFSFLPLNAYMRPGDPAPELEAALEEVLSGRFAHPRVDLEPLARLGASSLLVKDIFANLLAAWAAPRVPGVKPVLLMRHPLDVALSKLSLDDWHWMRRPTAFLDQPKLVEDHLAPQAALLAEVEAQGDPLLNYVAIWAVLAAVPFRQFAPQEAHVLFYEDCLVDPQGEMAALHAHLGHDPSWARVPASVLARPSYSSQASDVAGRRKSPYGAWRSKTTEAQRIRAAEILEAFGLAALYDPEGRPCRQALSAFRIGGA